MRISDWSSDVCSSDLLAARRARPVVIAMLAFGIGNGSVFQLVPQRFSAEIGVMTGLVGMAGGVGGFTLASSLGIARQWTGSFAPAFHLFPGLAVAALVALVFVNGQWRRSWAAAEGVRLFPSPQTSEEHPSEVPSLIRTQ